MLAALLLRSDAVVPERQSRELLTPSMPLSMQELGDVIVSESTLDGNSSSWADTAVLTMAHQFVCNVSQLPEAHAADHPALDHLEDLLLPNGTHLLIYGTSHLRSVRQVLTSVAKYFKHRVNSSLLSSSDGCDTSADGSPESPAEGEPCGIMGDRPCQDADLRRDEIEGGGGYRAIITSVTNIAQYQLPEHADNLEKLITEADPPFTHAYYMHAHTPKYFEAQCFKATTGVAPDPAKVGDAAEQGDYCDIVTPACQASTAQFAPFAKWLPEVGVRGGVNLKHDNDPKSAAARVFDTYKHFVYGHGGDRFTPDGVPGDFSGENWSPYAHACNIICAGAGTEEQACAPAEGLAVAWEVLRSAGLRQCFKGWKGCDPL